MRYCKKIMLLTLLFGLSLIIGTTAQAHHAFLDDIAATWPVTGDFLVYDGYEYVVQADGAANSLFQSDGDGTYTWATDITIGTLNTAEIRGMNGETINNVTDGTWDFGDAVLAAGNATLTAIDATVASVDAVAVYRGSVANDDDPDWIKKTAWTSWYQETLNTATRGATREFPAEYLIVALTDKVTIYDATGPDLAMWRVFLRDVTTPDNTTCWWRGSTSVQVSSVKMLNGVLVIGLNGAVTGQNSVLVVDFVDDVGSRYAVNGGEATNGGTGLKITELYEGQLPIKLSVSIVQYNVNAIALTCLDDAPINPATGMRYVTIDVFTDAGTSRITNDASGDPYVYDLVDTAADTHISGAINAADDSIAVNLTDPAIDVYEDVDADTNTVDRTYGAATTPALLSAPSSASKIVAYDTTIVHGNADGLTIINENPTTPASGAVVDITKDYNSGMMRGDIQLATLADIESGTVADLVINGDFDSALGAEWVRGNSATLTIDTGKLKVTNSVSSAGYAYQLVSTVIGKVYTLIVDYTQGTSPTAHIKYGDSYGTNAGLLNISSSGTYSITFTATSTITYIKLQNSTTISGATSLFDNISVTEVIPDRCVQANHLTTHGTLTKAAVATSAELMGWSGWSVANYGSLAYTADLDNGTDAFKYLVWLKEAANSAIEVIFERDSAATAQRITAQINADGTVSFTCDDDTTTRTATSTGTVDDETWDKLEFEYSAGTLNIYINDELDGTATGAALLTLSNATAVLNVGLDVQGANPLTHGNLTLLRTTKTASTDATRTADYQIELPMFTAGNKVTLSGSSDSVLALDYDSTTDTVEVLTDVRDTFSGLINIDQNAITGTGQCVSADGGTVLVGTSSQVTFDKPAINIREELAKRNPEAEQNNITDDNANTLTDDEMADTLHRHSELSASDGTPDAVVRVDADGITTIGDGTNQLKIGATGLVTLEGTAKGWITTRPQIQFDEINKEAKPALAARGIYQGYTMPVYAADNEELFLSTEVPKRWDGESDPIVHMTVALAAGEDVGDKFQFQCSWEHDGNPGEVLPDTSNDVPVETTLLTARNDAWDIYEVMFTIDYDVDGAGSEIESGECIGMRIRRIAASSLEITANVVVMKTDIHWQVNKMFGTN